VAGPLRVLRAMLAAAARAAAAPVPPYYAERDELAGAYEHREAAARAAQVRVMRLADARNILGRRSFGESLPVTRDIEALAGDRNADADAAMAAAAAADAPLLALARQVVEALVAIHDNGGGSEAADEAAAAAACAALFVARSRVLPAAARAERPPNALAATPGEVGRNAMNSWSQAQAALDAANGAAVCAHFAQLAAALRLPAEPSAAAAPDAAAVARLRVAARDVERGIQNLAHACNVQRPAPAETTAVAEAAAAVAAAAAVLRNVERAMA
jgi:hypothetical protein